jgi:hypothetical protein
MIISHSSHKWNLKSEFYTSGKKTHPKAEDSRTWKRNLHNRIYGIQFVNPFDLQWTIHPNLGETVSFGVQNSREWITSIKTYNGSRILPYNQIFNAEFHCNHTPLRSDRPHNRDPNRKPSIGGWLADYSGNLLKFQELYKNLHWALEQPKEAW